MSKVIDFETLNGLPPVDWGTGDTYRSVTIELLDNVPGAVIEPPDFPEVEISEDFDI